MRTCLWRSNWRKRSTFPSSLIPYSCALQEITALASKPNFPFLPHSVSLRTVSLPISPPAHKTFPSSLILHPCARWSCPRGHSFPSTFPSSLIPHPCAQSRSASPFHNRCLSLPPLFPIPVHTWLLAYEKPCRAFPSSLIPHPCAPMACVGETP